MNRQTLSILFCWLFCCIANITYCDDNTTKSVTISKDGISLTFGGQNWLAVDVDSIPFSSYSEMWFVNQSWSAYLFGYDNSKGLRSSIVATEDKITFDLIGEHEDFVGKQSFELLPGRILRNTVIGHVTSDTMTRLNYNYLSIHPGWLAGCHYTVVGKDGQTTSAVFPKIPKKLNLETANICKGIDKLNIDSVFGPIEISVTGNDFPISCLDYRNNTWDNFDYFVLLGISDYWYKTQEETSLTIDIKFPDKIDTKTVNDKKLASNIIKDDNVLLEDRGWDVIIPTPKHVDWINGEFPITNKTVVVYSSDKDVDLNACKRIATRFAKDAISTTKIRKANDAAKSKGSIHFSLDSTLQVENDSEYQVNITTALCTITAKTTDGLSLAEKTLRQLIRKDKNYVALKCVSIKDYPSLPFRGIHCFSGKNALKMQLRFFSKIFPILKVNKIVYECSYLKWDCNKFLRNELYGMDIADVKKVIAAAEKQDIEMIPMINTYGHSEWLLNYPEMKQYADDPQNIYAYDATNPEIYKICSAIYDECIRLFSPKIIHIGHDEIQGRDFPKREKGKAIGSANLILKDILYWHKFLKDKGIRTMMWGDMLLYLKESPDATNALTQESAKKLRDTLPKDIMMTDWHYAPAAPNLYKSLEIFNKSGFDAIAATWYTPENVTNFAREAYNQYSAPRKDNEGKTLGLLQTTWAGYNFNDEAIKGARHQFSCYVLAAETAWNGGLIDSDKTPYSFNEAFTRLYGDSAVPTKSSKGWRADLNYENKVRLEQLGVQNTQPTSGSLIYRFGHFNDSTTLSAIPLVGCYGKTDNAVSSLNVNVGGELSDKILFVVSTPYSGSPSRAIAQTTVTYNDSTSDTIDWVLGKNVLSLNDHRDFPSVPTVARFVSSGDTPTVSIHGYLFEPKHKPIKGISFKSCESGPELLIFDILGLK